MKPRYALVRDGGTDDVKQFKKWHQTKEEALNEAKRLCRKENSSFLVLKEVIRCSIKESPVETEELEDSVKYEEPPY